MQELELPCRLGESADDFDADLVVSEVTDRGPRVQQLRERSDVLFVALLPSDTAVMEALDVIDAGADDFLVKPISPRELVTKTRALLRRQPKRTGPSRPLVFDGLVIDVAARGS